MESFLILVFCVRDLLLFYIFFEMGLFLAILFFLLASLFFTKKSQISIYIYEICFYNQKTVNLIIYVTFSFIFSSCHQNVECMTPGHPDTEGHFESWSSIFMHYLGYSNRTEAVQVADGSKMSE